MPDEIHSSLSPSGRHRWGACPGSVRLESAYPEDKGGAAALDGTRTHALLEHLIKWEFINKEGVCGPLPMWQSTHTDEHGTFTVDSDRAARLNVVMEYIRDHVDEHGGNVIAEQRVFPDGLVGRADMHGTVDVQVTGKFIYLVADLKDGMSPVSAVDNPQLEQYALGVLAGLAEENYPRKFRLAIIQPKLALKGLPVVSTWDITPAELLAMVPVIIAQAAATEAPDAPLVPGEAQCKYCRAKGSCPAIAQQAMQGIGAMFSPVVNPEPHSGMFGPSPAVPVDPLPAFLAKAYPDGMGHLITPEVMPASTPDMAQVLAARDPHQMDNDQLRQLMEAAPLVNQLLDGVKKEIERRLHSGQIVPGYKLVNGNGSRQWALPEEEMVKKLTGMAIPKNALYKQSFLSVAQVEKLVWDKKGEPCQLSDRQKKTMEQEYVIKKPGAPVVAPESDPRQAITKDVSALFAPVITAEMEMNANDVARGIDLASVPTIPSFLAPSKPSFLQ